jgi:hypothetical protein
MTRLKPLVKGIITAVVMMIMSLAIYYTGASAASAIGYIIYAAYAGGIIWTIATYANLHPENRTFGQLFNQGFRCFIVITFLMVAFTAAIYNLNPEWVEESAKLYKEDLLKQGNKASKTPEEIESAIAAYKKQFIVSIVAASVFGYLIIGALITAVTSGFFLRRK